MEDLNKEFVPYDLALRLKKIGFNLPCFFAFDNCSTPMRCSDLRTNQQKFSGVNYNSSSYTSQPTFSQALGWFREFVNWPIESWVQPYLSEAPRMHEALYWRRGETVSVGIFKTHEQAELALLEKILEIVEQIEKL